MTKAEIFNSARKLYPGTKLGNKIEFANFKKKNKKTWEKILPLLKPAIQKQIEWRETDEWRPLWKMFQTWINQSCWQYELSTICMAKKTKLFPITGKICSEKKCNLPAVYKNTSGAYDHYHCSKHLPENVKAEFE